MTRALVLGALIVLILLTIRFIGVYLVEPWIKL
jgi:hypothetical protein